MTYVYLLSTYEEHGAEDIVATLDRERLPELLKAYTAGNDETNERWEEYKEECLPVLMALLHRPDDKLVGSSNNLSNGWGGIQFHVVELR